jgi:hypothetical protein
VLAGLVKIRKRGGPAPAVFPPVVYTPGALVYVPFCNLGFRMREDYVDALSFVPDPHLIVRSHNPSCEHIPDAKCMHKLRPILQLPPHVQNALDTMKEGVIVPGKAQTRLG